MTTLRRIATDSLMARVAYRMAFISILTCRRGSMFDGPLNAAAHTPGPMAS